MFFRWWPSRNRLSHTGGLSLPVSWCGGGGEGEGGGGDGESRGGGAGVQDGGGGGIGGLGEGGGEGGGRGLGGAGGGGEGGGRGGGGAGGGAAGGGELPKKKLVRLVRLVRLVVALEGAKIIISAARKTIVPPMEANTTSMRLKLFAELLLRVLVFLPLRFLAGLAGESSSCGSAGGRIFLYFLPFLLVVPFVAPEMRATASKGSSASPAGGSCAAGISSGATRAARLGFLPAMIAAPLAGLGIEVPAACTDSK